MTQQTQQKNPAFLWVVVAFFIIKGAYEIATAGVSMGPLGSIIAGLGLAWNIRLQQKQLMGVPMVVSLVMILGGTIMVVWDLFG